MALGQFGPAARPAAPLILETLRTREDLQWVSKSALREIAPEMLGREPWHGANLRLGQTTPLFDSHPVRPTPQTAIATITRILEDLL
jgi:hypothetical protein